MRLPVRVYVDGLLAQQDSTGGRIRGVAALIADVSDFMTLQPGDLLLLGADGEPAAGARRSGGGGRDRGSGPARFSLVAEGGAG